MNKGHIWPAWARILQGRRPLLSIEVTRECPLRCPGCYAYDGEHLATVGSLRNLSDLRGDALVKGVLDLVHRLRPIHVSIVGGEPLVRYRELSVLLPVLSQMGLEVQLVTSAVRPIPAAWRNLRNINLSVSVDGLQPEHDKRRAPATYDRILKHIEGHRIRVHCVVTRHQLQRSGYLKEFAAFWSKRDEVLKIWFSLYTPQHGERSEERLTPEDRNRAVAELMELRSLFPKVDAPQAVLAGFLKPPQTPEECLFAQTTTCVSADLSTRITPCQLGGRPVCTECGCIASAGLAGVGQKKLAGMFSLADIFSISASIGKKVSRAA